MRLRNPCKISRSSSKIELEKEVTMPVSFFSLEKLVKSGSFDKSTFVDLFTLPKPRAERKKSSTRLPRKPSPPQSAPSNPPQLANSIPRQLSPSGPQQRAPSSSPQLAPSSPQQSGSSSPPKLAPSSPQKLVLSCPPQLASSVFVTPELDFPPSQSPSPYSIKVRKRGQFLVESSPVPDLSWNKEEALEVKAGESETARDNEHDAPSKVLMEDSVKNVEEDYCFERQDSASCVTTDVDDDSIGSTSKNFLRHLSAANFYDDISGEISPRMYTMRDYEAELTELRANVAAEVEAKKKAEEAMSSMVSYWKTMREHLLSAGISLPEYHMSGPSPAMEICEQVDVARYVSNAIGRGVGKVETEMVMEKKLKQKDMEIGRLMEQVKDYDELKRELCRRREEAVELTRLYKSLKKKNQWLWGSVAAGMSLGTASLVCYYLGNGDVSSSVTGDVLAIEQ